MTGKYPARLHITDWIAGHNRPYAKLKIPDWTQYLPHEEMTIAEVFTSRRLRHRATSANGTSGNEETGPLTQGFDSTSAAPCAAQPPQLFLPVRERRSLPD